MTTWVILILLLVSCAGSATVDSESSELKDAAGNVYHVAEAGSDANDGSAASPWASIQHAVDSVSPGDTIWIHAGRYAGARIEQSGTAENWLTLSAAPNEQPVLDGPGPDNRHDSTLELETWEGSGTVSYWVVSGLEVTGAPGWGIDLRGNEGEHSHHLIIRDTRVHDNGWESSSTGIFTAYVDDVLIEGNESYNNGEHGIYLSNSGDRPVVRGNRLHHNAFCGLHMNGDIAFGGDGTISEGLVENNLIYENGLEGGCSGINMDSVTHSVVRNNLLYENHAGGISLYRESGAVCSHDNRILHNTIFQAEDARWALNIADFAGDGSECINNQLFGNILYNQHAWRGSIELQRPDIPGLQSDYNVLMDRITADDGNTVLKLEEWQAFGYDAHSLIATPAELFVNPAAGDYHLLPEAPAVDAAISLPDVPADFEGDPRPLGPRPDIGADERLSLTEWNYQPLTFGPAGAQSGKAEGTNQGAGRLVTRPQFR